MKKKFNIHPTLLYSLFSFLYLCLTDPISVSFPVRIILFVMNAENMFLAFSLSLAVLPPFPLPQPTLTLFSQVYPGSYSVSYFVWKEKEIRRSGESL